MTPFNSISHNDAKAFNANDASSMTVTWVGKEGRQGQNGHVTLITCAFGLGCLRPSELSVERSEGCIVLSKFAGETSHQRTPDSSSPPPYPCRGMRGMPIRCLSELSLPSHNKRGHGRGGVRSFCSGSSNA